MRGVRIFFSKKGLVKYVSHLDLMRSMTRAVRRAGVPLWYTEGYNPHPYLNFLCPLALGVEGDFEPLDIRIEGEIKNEKIKEDLNDVLPRGLRIESVSDPFLRGNEIAFGEYEILFSKDDISVDALKKALDSGELVCQKKGKQNGRKTVKSVNISESLKKYSIAENKDVIELNMILPSGNEKNVSPINFMAGVNEFLNSEIIPLNIIRKRLLDKDYQTFY